MSRKGDIKMTDEIMELLNQNKGARKLKEEFENYVKTSDLSQEEIEEERKTMIMMAMTLVPETIHMMGKEIQDRKSTRLNSSHVSISYAVFCLKKKKITNIHII